MQIVAQHQITDPNGFFAAIPSVAQNTPPGVHLLIGAPSTDRTTAICLWQADSLESLREYLDVVETEGLNLLEDHLNVVSEGLCTTSYFVVDESVAVGLPHAAQPA